MATKHYKISMKGGTSHKVAMTQREVKQYIMRVNGWNETQYRKQYDIFKNKLRAYEAIQAQSKPVKPQSVVDVLYREAKAKARYGADYTPSQKMREIQATKAYSISKGRRMARQEEYLQRERERYMGYVKSRFGGLIEFARSDVETNGDGAMEVSKSIMEMVSKISNPVKLEQALSDLANEWEKSRRSAGIVNGERVGSDEADIDFDYSAYL